MKKIITLIILCFTINCQAQIKIGDITISDLLAKEYFLDCYQHPDTLYRATWYDFAPNKYSGIIMDYERKEYEEKAKKIDDYIDANKISNELSTTIFVPEGNDTIWNGILPLIGGVNKKQGKMEIMHHDAYSYENHTQLYLVPRKPSVEDFAKWMSDKNIFYIKK